MQVSPKAVFLFIVISHFFLNNPSKDQKLFFLFFLFTLLSFTTLLHCLLLFKNYWAPTISLSI